MSKICQLNLFPSRKFRCDNFPPFNCCQSTFRQLQVLIVIMNQIAFKFIAVLTGMGIVAASTCGYIAVVMYSDTTFPLLLYLSACFIYCIAFIVNFVLITLAAIPNKCGDEFQCYWKRNLKSGYNRKCLKACPTVGFRVAVVSKVKRQTSLTISDTILNFTATMVLTQQNM